MENNNYENVLEDGNVLTCITHNKVIEVSTYAQKANVIGILQRVLAIISLAGMAIVILLNLAAIMRCIKKRSFDLEEFDLFTGRGYNLCYHLCRLRSCLVISVIRLFFGIY